MSPGPLFTLCVRLADMVSKLPVFLLNSFYRDIQ